MIVIATAIGPMALNILLPAMPGLMDAFSADYATVQLTLGLYLIGVAVGQLIYGPLSDRFGRRPVLLVGFAIYTLSCVVGLLASSIGLLLVARVVQSVGGCVGIVLSRAIVRDMYERDKAASMLGYVTMGMVLAPMFSPLIGGVLDGFGGWQAIFIFMAVTGALTLLGSALFMHETNFNRQPLPHLGGMVDAYASLLRRPAFRTYALQTAFTSASFFMFLGGGPYVVVEVYGETSQTYGLFFILMAAGYMTGNLVTGRMAERMGVDRMILVGTTCSLVGAVGVLGFAVADLRDPLALFGPMVLLTFGNGLSLPNGMAGAVSVDPSRAGAASGLSGFFQMGLGAVCSLAVAAVLADSAIPLALAIVAATTGAVVVHAVALRRLRRAAATPAPPA